jgi:E2/UBC family protein C/ThiF family protein
MALADYYARGALAAAQVLDGFDEARFQAKLDETPVGIAFDAAAELADGKALTDLLVRLLARLYPRIALSGPQSRVGELSELAKGINPAIDISDEAIVGVALGAVRQPFETTFYAGARGWDALIGTSGPRPTGDSDNPFGAAAAACFAAANVFRRVFLPDWQKLADESLRFSTWHMNRTERATRTYDGWRNLGDENVLVGGGAIGNAALWALAQIPAAGVLHVVDPQNIELSNLQRYVLARRADEGRSKADLAAALPTKGLTIIPHPIAQAEFLNQYGYKWSRFLLGLDSAADRRDAQASLPKWIANAWTQPGDLGVSTHAAFGGDGACVACLYLPDGRVKNEDELVAATLGIPQLQMEVRTLLYTNAPLHHAFLEAVAAAVSMPIDTLLAFEGRSIRELYVEGFCGGTVIPIGQAGRPSQDVHVPLAHQSALAGILLAATFARSSMGGDPPITTATRLDVLKAVGSNLDQPLRAARDGRCICDDLIYRDQYAAKYH